ncbi:MAG: Mth938-like domain-containing protein [Geminicoccaceae bacterium]|nr:Mth938-like domain-containing protein [Geminicoccaceae bacterium]MCX7630395.1 Mth938-like domain-containing protein [Geminicoccaceae bacterium]MDW8125247.1 Mth938-like domain-containing protein [Geminicoccaceae bacterium]
MEIVRLSSPDRPFVRAWHAGGFTVGERRYTGSLLLLPDRVEPWRPIDPAALAPPDLEPLRPWAGSAVTLVVIGTGLRSQRPSPALCAALRGLGLAFETMSTPAACRTWNLLLADDRPAAALLVALP